MKKGKPTPPSKLVLFTLSALVLGLLLGRFLPLPLVQVPNTYKCPLDLPRYFNDPIEHEEIIQLLDFDHPQLLEGIYYEEIIWHSLILECSIVNGEAYIALV